MGKANSKEISMTSDELAEWWQGSELYETIVWDGDAQRERSEAIIEHVWVLLTHRFLRDRTTDDLRQNINAVIAAHEEIKAEIFGAAKPSRRGK